MANEKRLIDANKLNAVLQNMAEHLTENGDALIAACLIQCQEVVERQRTVDAVEVVHGHWEDGWGVNHVGEKAYDSIDCSVCEEIFKIESHDREYWKDRFKVCPFCGAKMDGDGNGT